jgi:hypothetical protein
MKRLHLLCEGGMQVLEADLNVTPTSSSGTALLY